MAFWIVLAVIALITALLTYHDLRRQVAPHSYREEELRVELLDLMRTKMIPAFVSAADLASHLAYLERDKIKDRELADSIYIATLVRTVPHSRTSKIYY